MLLYLPAFNRSLWHSVSNAGHLVAGDIASRQYAAAALAAIGGALAALSSIGTVYVMIRLTRRAARVVSRRTAGHPGRRLIAVVAAFAIAGSLVLFWVSQGQFRGW
jgi:putative peptide zinc metalloprotease protein